MPFQPRFLIISIGNPLPKYDSLHSAGHFVLSALPPLLNHPPLSPSSLPIKHTEPFLASPGPKYTLIQSPTLMNLSGPFVAKAWLDAISRQPLTQSQSQTQNKSQNQAQNPDKKQGQNQAGLSLVIIHDELDKDLGTASLVPWERSPRGHNGIKSIKQALHRERWPDAPFVRIAVGIGRPEARDSETVSRYVLGRMAGHTRRVLEGEVAMRVVKCLQELEEEWRSEVE